MAFYPAIPASDGTSMEARENSEFQVFEVYDTARATPLRLLSTAGTNAAPLVTTAQGVVPPVEVVSPNVSHVFKSGAWEWRRDSFDGAEVAVKEARNAAGVAASAAQEAAARAQAPTDESVDRGIQRAGLPAIVAQAVSDAPGVTAAAAQLAQSSAGLVRKTDPGIPSVGEAEGRLAVIRDADGHETWLGARASDGGPTDWAMHHLQERLGVGAVDSPAYLFAITDSEGRMTDLAVRASDGQFPEFVIDRLRARILDGFNPGTSVPTPALPPPIYVDAPYVPGSDILPVHADMTRAAGWGSSSMEGAAAQLATMFSARGASFTAGGKGGESAEQTAARMGAIPALVTVTGGAVPSSGPVSITTSNMPRTSNLKPYTGTLSGVAGTISYQEDPVAYVFTRTTEGPVVPVPANTPFTPDANVCRDAVNLLWIGKNNLTANTTTADTVIRLTNQCFDWLAPLQKRCLVLGHFADSTLPEVSAERVQILKANAALKARYGRAFIDVHSYLASPQVWADTGITPTAADLEAQRVGNKPPSLSKDVAHLNTAGNVAITALVAARLTELGWYTV